MSTVRRTYSLLGIRFPESGGQIGQIRRLTCGSSSRSKIFGGRAPEGAGAEFYSGVKRIGFLHLLGVTTNQR